jgi:hypothetical protein
MHPRDAVTMMTLIEAGRLLDLSPITLRLQVRNGKLAAEKRGRDWFVSQREVERYRAENKREVSNVQDGTLGD